MTCWDSTRTPTQALLAIAAIIVVAVAGFALLRPSGPAVVGAPVSDGIPRPVAFANPVPVSDIRIVVFWRHRECCDRMTADDAAEAQHMYSIVITEPMLPPRQAECRSPAGSGLSLQLPQWCQVALRAQVRTGDRCGRLCNLEEPAGCRGGVRPRGRCRVGSGGDDLYLLKGDLLVTILSLEGPDPTLTLEAAKAIGAIVATRM